MKSLKGSQTEKNILTAFAGESQARNRYTYFAGKAREDGFMQIAAIFTETADQEREHAKRFFTFLEGGEAAVSATFPAGSVGSAEENLAAAADGERYEWTTMYPSFARVARDEGYEIVARAFEAISVAEKQHEKRYAALRENVKNDRVFKRETPEMTALGIGVTVRLRATKGHVRRLEFRRRRCFGMQKREEPRSAAFFQPPVLGNDG